MDLISVIVPVYNTANVLARCLESLLLQQNTQYEILLVNDGSTDESGSICNSYAARNDNIKVIHKDNGGVSSARNAGIEQALGEWICFVDSDDTILPGFLSALQSTAKKSGADVALCGYLHQQNTQWIPVRPKSGTVLVEAMRQNIGAYGKGIWTNTPFNKLLRADIIKKNALRFDEELTIGEDWKFNLEVFSHSKLLAANGDCFYQYRENVSSAMRCADKTFIAQNKIVLEYALDFFAPSPNQERQVFRLTNWVYVLQHEISVSKTVAERRAARKTVLDDPYYRKSLDGLDSSPFSVRMLAYAMDKKRLPTWAFSPRLGRIAARLAKII